ncbi:MAG: LytTR family DNA-binding domain-containing protein [Eubacteriales bacterium]
MLKIAICDDDISLCTNLEQMITQFHPDCTITPFYEGETLVRYMQEHGGFDLLFLDIEMKSMNGIAVGQTIRNQLDDHITRILYISAKTGYEQALFDVQPLNFFRKPIKPEKLKHCLELVTKLTERDTRLFEYSIRHDRYKIKLEDILYFESQGKKMKLVTTHKPALFYGNFAEITKQLPNNFISTHKSYLVNLNHCYKISSKEIIMVNQDRIPISTRNLKDLRARLVALEKEVSHG